MIKKAGDTMQRSHNRFRTCGLATGVAAGTAGLLSVPASADAAIIWSGIRNVTVQDPVTAGKNSSAILNLDTDGTYQLRLYFAQDKTYGHSVGISQELTPNVQLLASGGKIPGNVALRRYGQDTVLPPVNPIWGINGHAYFGGYPQYPWAPGDSAYAAFRLLASDTTIRYGWIQLSINSALSTVTAVQWAYDDAPGTPVSAGFVPEPSGALLYLGLAGFGILLFRPRHKAVSAA